VNWMNVAEDILCFNGLKIINLSVTRKVSGHTAPNVVLSFFLWPTRT
jgi:hypothetical protein